MSIRLLITGTLVSVALWIGCGNQDGASDLRARAAADGLAADAALPPGDISVDQLHDILVTQERDIYLLDVRTQAEWEHMRLSFADDRIPFDSIAFHMDDLPGDKAQPLYIYCRTGRRSGIAAEFLRLRGYDSVYNVAGGIVQWARRDYPTVSDD